MKNTSTKLFISLILFLPSLTISAQDTCTSNGTGGGEWDAATTWTCTGSASYPDLTVSTINILEDDIIDIIGNEGRWWNSGAWEYLDVTINLSGTLDFGPGFLVIGRLYLSSSSKIIFSSTGTAISGGTSYDRIYIGGNRVWDGADDEIQGPGTLDENSSNGTLPIELIAFNTTLSGEVVEILWATAAEIDNDYFTVERSEDGVNWEIIGEKAGAGNSTIRLDYSFIDHNPIPGISYYRLKQTDYDGQFEYFDPAVVLYEPDNLFKVFPNPTADVLHLTTSSDLSNATISIKNLSGQNKTIRVDAASHQATINVSALPTGVYLLEIVFPQSVLTKRIVKN